MKTKLTFFSLSILLGLVLALFACEKISLEDQPSIAAKNANANTPAAQQNLTTTYQFKVGAPFFANPFVEAEASNGDIIEVAGEGTLSVNPKSVSGNGTFVHKDANGVVGSGTWTATQLLNFVEYGPSTDPSFPIPAGRAGYAKMHVDLMAGGNQLSGVLWVYCRLPGTKIPPSVPEGIRLNIHGGLNFTKVPGEGNFGGPTLFILQ